MTFTLTREQLYELVWSVPMQRLAREIGISDVALAKHCRKLGIPVPERGFWNKLQAGKSVIRAKLPERDLATINRVTISGDLPSDLRARLKREPGDSTDPEESIDVLAERFRKRLGTVAVPRDFSRMHPAIATLLKKDDKLQEEYTQHPYSWHKPRFQTPFERRRLRFLNGLFLAFEQVRARPSLRGSEARELCVHMGDITLEFQLDAPDKIRLERRSRSSNSQTPDALCLAIADRRTTLDLVKQWQDEEGRPLEKQLTEIVVGMAVAGEQLHRQWLIEMAEWERRHQEEEQKEAQRRKEEAEKRKRERLAAIEKAKIDGLIGDATNWRDASNIRAYVEAVQKARAGHCDLEELEAWSRWALAEADRLDPIVSGRALLLSTNEAEPH